MSQVKTVLLMLALHNGYIFCKCLQVNTTNCTLIVDRRWAAGLFLYQSFDAIDGYACVPRHLFVAHPSIGNMLGERAWQGLLERCSTMVRDLMKTGITPP